jgi:hypothetical protein
MKEIIVRLPPPLRTEVEAFQLRSGDETVADAARRLIRLGLKNVESGKP